MRCASFCMPKQSMAQPEPGCVRLAVQLDRKFYPFVKAASDKFVEKGRQCPKVCCCPFGLGYLVIHYHPQEYQDLVEIYLQILKPEQFLRL